MVKNVCNSGGDKIRKTNVVFAFLIYESIAERVFRKRYTDPQEFDLGVRIPSADIPHLFQDAPDPRQHAGTNENGRHFDGKLPPYYSIVDYLKGGTQKPNGNTEVLGLKINTIGIAERKLFPAKVLREEAGYYLTNYDVMGSSYAQRRGRDVFVNEFDETSFVHMLFYRIALYRDARYWVRVALGCAPTGSRAAAAPSDGRRSAW